MKNDNLLSNICEVIIRWENRIMYLVQMTGMQKAALDV